MTYSKQRLITLTFTFAISVHFLVLYANTPSENFELLEALKIFAPLFSLGILSILANELRIQIIKYSFYALSIHIFIAISETIIRGPGYFITEDGRFAAQLLGRGAGETAWAFCVFLVTFNFLRELRYIKVAPRIQKVITFGAILIVCLTQARSAILFLTIYYIARFGSKTESKIGDVFKIFGIGFIVVIVAYAVNPIFHQVIARSLSLETVLTGREYIWAAKMAAFSDQAVVNLLFGSDLLPKVHEVVAIGYVTADPHNLYIDIFQYYGILGVTYTILWYKFATKHRFTSATPIILAFIGMCMFVSPFRYSMVFYVNTILLLTITIRPNLNSRMM